MNPLTARQSSDLRDVRTRIGAGPALSQEALDAFCKEWNSIVAPDGKDAEERFAVARPDGSTTGVTGPRWLFHLLGLRHRASHVGLSTESGLIVLQRRSTEKADWPGAWDMAVAGHVSDLASYLDGALTETEEELGLPTLDLPDLLVEGGLIPVGAPFATFERINDRNPPFCDSEVVQLFAAMLTSAGLARLYPDPEELAGVYLCSTEEAWRILVEEEIAAGLRYTLPRYLDWLAHKDAPHTTREANSS